MTPIALGIASIAGGQARPVARRGRRLAELSILEMMGRFDSVTGPVRYFQSDTLNAFMAAGPPVWTGVLDLLRGSDDFRLDEAAASMRLPCRIGDYTDFYSSLHHAFRVGSLFRGPEQALNPNWKRLPVGYHGRSSSIVVSGTPVRRPCGLRPDYGPTLKLDFELETGVYIGMASAPGSPVPIRDTDSHLFGWTLVNDWSARDIQSFEYVPLGPFTSKNFATSVSPWIFPISELDVFRRPLPAQDPEPADYLRRDPDWTYDIHLEVLLNGDLITLTNQNTLYWSIRQQIAHHTVTGCNLNPGDLLASGTISGPDAGSEGCLLEKGGAFLEDGDTVVMRAYALNNGRRVELTEVSGTILPANG